MDKTCAQELDDLLQSNPTDARTSAREIALRYRATLSGPDRASLRAELIAQREAARAIGRGSAAVPAVPEDGTLAKKISMLGAAIAVLVDDV
jgi:hypothetical protein